MNSETAIKIEQLSKMFGDIYVIKNSNMTVPKGCVYGFLGANGAGKTTIFKILTGLITPTNGTATVMGFDVTKDREKILREVGSLIETPVFYEHLSADALMILGVNVLAVGGIGVVSMRIGFIKKSVPMTMIAAFILSATYGNAIMAANSLMPGMIIGSVGIIVTVAVMFELAKKINTLEVE